MKKIILSAAILMLFFVSNDQTESAELTTNAITKRGCATQKEY
jgi:hypothetical protein